MRGALAASFRTCNDPRTLNAQGITTHSGAIEKTYDLNVGVIGQGAARHERPHKPVLILAVLDLIAIREARPDLVVWSEGLRSRFRLNFEVVASANDQNTQRPLNQWKKGGSILQQLVAELPHRLIPHEIHPKRA